MSKDLERKRPSLLIEGINFLDLVYHSMVREVRLISGTSGLGLLLAVFKTLTMVAAFYAMFAVIGLRGSVIRGDMVLFLISGILLFLVHNAAIGKTLQAGSSTSPIMQHAPMTPALMILAKTMADFYMFVLSTLIIVAGLFVFKDNLEIYDPIGLILPFILAWASGVAIGLLFLMIKPLMPNLLEAISKFYMRANMVTSGKFFVANMLPLSVLPFFAWNPLFHTIDQARGAMFVNYVPNKTSIEYPIYFVLIGVLVGMMGEFWIRKTVSKSKAATQ